MRPPKEVVFLLVLLFCAMASVLWYVIDRRARMRAEPAVSYVPLGLPVAAPAGPAVAKSTRSTTAPAPSANAAAVGAPMVDLTQHDRQTIDFSSGRPVIKDSPADQAALAAGLKDIAEATKDVTVGPPAKPASPPPPPAKP